MVDPKQINEILKSLIYLYIFLFPLGPLLRIGIFSLRIHPTDLLVLLIALVSSYRFNLVKEMNYFKVFILLLVFTFVVSLFIFNFSGLFGLLYLIRLVSYLILFETIYLLIKLKEIDKRQFSFGLLYISAVVIITGLIQYLLVPDLRTLTEFGWDDHYGRLAGTFLDPGFAGIMLTLSLLFLVHHRLKSKSKLTVVLIGMNLMAVWLTFSRATYAAFIAGVVFLLWKRLNKIILAALIMGFIFALPLLPKFSSEGTDLLRTSSVYARLDDYQRTVEVFARSPLLGIGYNNLCEYKIKYLKDSSFYSHACSGSDSSLLLLLSTVGAAGVVGFFYSINKLRRSIKQDMSKNIVFSSVLAVFVHSIFTNSLFYPWVMGWLAILISMRIKTKV